MFCLVRDKSGERICNIRSFFFFISIVLQSPVTYRTAPVTDGTYRTAESRSSSLNRGQIDSSRESVTLQRLPNGVRLTPFEGSQRPAGRDAAGRDRGYRPGFDVITIQQVIYVGLLLWHIVIEIKTNTYFELCIVVYVNVEVQMCDQYVSVPIKY